MSIAYNSSIVRDGLTFYFDASNTKKSWKGKPTTNLIVSTPLTLSLYAYASGPVTTTGIVDYENQVRSVRRYTVTSAVNTARAAIYPTGLSAGIDYAFSFIVKYNGNNTATPTFAADASKGSPEGGANNNSFTSETVTTTSLGLGWYYIRYTFNFSSCPTGACILTYGVVTGSDSTYVGNTFDIYNEQFELSSFVTPYVNGSRSNTQAILDLTNNRTVTAQEVTYNSNGTFSFNNTANWCEISSLPAQTDSPLSVFAWVYLNATPTGTNGIWGHYGSSAVNCHFETYSTYTRVRLGNVNNTSLPVMATGTWVNVGFTSNGTAHKYYVNGVEQASWSGNTGTLFGSFTHMFGRSDVGRTWNGRINALQVYLRQLSANEVTNNFTAQRGQYGI